MRSQIAKAVLGKNKVEGIVIPNFLFLTSSQMMPKYCFLEHTLHSKTPEVVIKLLHASESPRRYAPRFDSVGLEWGPRFCIFNKFLGDTNAISLNHTLRTNVLDYYFAHLTVHKNLPLATAKFEGSQNFPHSPLHFFLQSGLGTK